MLCCVQEQALKLFKRTYVLGDPQKLDDFTVAMKALKEVRPPSNHDAHRTLVRVNSTSAAHSARNCSTACLTQQQASARQTER